jgi:hypothetical protein
MKSKFEIKNWSDLDQTILKLGNLDLEIERQSNQMQVRCLQIKKEHQELIDLCETNKKDLLKETEGFFLDHESEVKGRTYEGTFGKCGLRLTPPAVKPAGKMTWERVLSRILDLGYKSKLLRPLVHTIKDIDRELLSSDKISEDLRKEIGVKLSQSENFWYEVKA